MSIGQFIDDDEDMPSTNNQEKVVNEDLGIVYYDVDLPSKGKLGYPETIEYRDILVRDEKMISSSTVENYASTLNKVLKSLLKDQSFFDNITIYDRDFLLLWIWANNYSTTKHIEISCPHCENKDEVVVDLTKIDISDVKDDIEYPFVMKLSTGEDIKLRLITVKDEKIAQDFVKRNKKYDYSTVLLSLTVTFKTIMPLREKLIHIEDNMKGKDMGLVRAFHEYFNYGINDDIDHTCESCGEVTQFSIPFQPDFFLPTVQDDFEKMLYTNKKSKNKSD